MKRLFGFMMATAGMLLLTACEQNFADFEKTKFDGRDISGVWAHVTYDIPAEFYDFDCGVAEVLIFDGNTVSIGSILKDNGIHRLYEFKNGYIYGCSYDDVKISYTTDLNIEGDAIHLTQEFFGFSNTIERDGNKLILKEETGLPYDTPTYKTFEKVKGFKPAK